jgi:hypothetical protein
MGRDRDFADEWGNLTPEQTPSGYGWVLWLGVALVALCLIGVCLVGAYLFISQAQRRATVVPPPPLIIPTSPFTLTRTAEAQVATADPLFAPTATLPQAGSTTAPPVGPGNVEAIQLSAPPTIDGNLAEWAAVNTYQSAFRVYSASSWDGTDDLTAMWRLVWDNNALYIGVAVTDDIHVQTQTGNTIFRGDSVDIQFDTDRAGDFGPRLSPDDFQITLSPGDFAGLSPTAFRYRGTIDDQILDAPGGHHVTVAAQQTDQGYNLEAAIPWSDLELTPTAGAVIGLALNANDNDTPGTAVQEVMMSHVAGRTLTNPTTWGTLTLQ